MLSKMYWRRYGKSYFHQPQPVGQSFTPGQLSGYYNDLTGKADFKGPTSVAGIPLRVLPSGRLIEMPVSAAQMALGLYDRWLQDGNSLDKERFVNIADHLRKTVTSRPVGLVWTYDVDLPYYSGLKAPWISAMGQGEAISVLVRAYQLTGEQSYLQIAQDAVQPLRTPVAEGGVGLSTEHGWWLEEYPTSQPSQVLNGCIFAAWGLYDLGLMGDEGAQNLFDNVVRTIVASLPAYDLAGWSRYDLYPSLLPRPASPSYHQLHIAQLEAMWRLTSHKAFATYRDRWQKGADSEMRASAALALKTAQKVTWRASQLLNRFGVLRPSQMP